MSSRRFRFRLSAQFIIGAFALLTFAGAGVAEEGAPIVVVEGKPPGVCKNLGKVTGVTQRSPLDEAGAMRDALKQARDLGATHFWYKAEYSGQRGSVTWVYYGVAYRCQAAPAPSPTK